MDGFQCRGLDLFCAGLGGEVTKRAAVGTELIIDCGCPGAAEGVLPPRGPRREKGCRPAGWPSPQAGPTASLPPWASSVSAARCSQSAGGRDAQRESGPAGLLLREVREAKEVFDLPVKV